MWGWPPRPSSDAAGERQWHKPNRHALARNDPLPVRPPRQHRRRLRRPALLLKPRRRPHGRLSRDEQPVQRRAGARQGRIFRARAQKRMLPTTQLGIFRKDNFFEVVLDPSPDKPEKRILGPAPSCQQIRRSTGVHLTQPRRQPATKLIHSHRSPCIPSISVRRPCRSCSRGICPCGNGRFRPSRFV